ncbi:MAG: translocation/assembly module TamB domain-containing protein [Elusimicrobia bacterium]|nr:translocation/assembly module TamB domain-containing protein [Elusimicrobiota bacterium]
MKSEALPALRVHGSLPWAWVIGAGGQETMDLSLDPLELDPAKLLKGNPDVKVGPGGFLRVGGRVVGKKNNLSVEGELVGGVPSLKIPLAEVDVSDLRLDLELRNQRLRVRQVRAKWGKGFFRLSGESFLPNLSLDIEGKDISFRVPRRLAMKTDLNLHVGGTLSHPVLTGDIPVTEATYEVEKKKSKEPEKETNETFLHLWDILKLNVNTGWKNNVWYRDGLTKVETKADVVVSKEGGDRIPGVTGVVSIVRGNYDAYGKDFVLKSGEFVFTDPTELNPQVTLRALHKMRDYLIELNVSGTARRPELRFQSTPPLPEPDILALLAIGKAPGQGAGESSSGAADLAAGWASDFLTREIRSAGMNVLDLDVVRVSPTDKGTEWTVGRYWGSKLFLSFSYIADESASQVLKGEYSLSPQWYLVGQTGSKSDNYVDLNFRLPVGKSRIKE